MRAVYVCADQFLAVLGPNTAAGEHPLYVVETASSRRRIAERGGKAVAGALTSETTYRRAFRTGTEPAVVAVEPSRQARVVAALRRVAPEAPILVVTDGRAPDLGEGVTTISTGAFLERVVDPEVERAVTRGRVDRLRGLLAAAERVLIMMQDDPDPDAIASALALRTLLGRNKTAAPLASFGTITRPENRAMTNILEIDVERISPGEVAAFDMVAMVDVQPSFFEERFSDVALVIDHHPEDPPVNARIKDIRPSYGATSTILTEYLRAADVKCPQRLATALLYGIKADTLHLERGATKADMEAFAFLHGLANHRALRRIERPELPNEALDLLAAGIARRRLAHGVVFSHLGAVAYRELVPQFADFLLQIEGAEWSVVSGTASGEVHVSVRNVGYIRSAGEVVRHAFGDLGSAGGHRSMARAVIRLPQWRAEVGETTDEAISDAVMTRFLLALRS